MQPANVKKVILATCVLHNFMREHDTTLYCPPGFADSVDPNGNLVDGTWRLDNNEQLETFNNRHFTPDGSSVRDHLKNYFIGPGSMEWQINYIRRTH